MTFVVLDATQDFKRGGEPSGIISIKDHVVEGSASPLEFGCAPRLVVSSWPSPLDRPVRSGSAAKIAPISSRQTTRVWLAVGLRLFARFRSAVSDASLWNN